MEQKFPPMTREQTEDAIAIQEVRVQRLKDGDFTVEEEDFDEYPLFIGTSVMFYHTMPSREEDFPNYEERLEAWHGLNQFSMQQTTTAMPGDRPVVMPPTMYKVAEMLLLHMNEEHNWRAQLRFIEMVMATHSRHIIAYWPANQGLERAVDTLCVFTAYSVLLTPNVNRKNEAHHHLGELAAPFEHSRLKQLHADIRKKGFDFATIYMAYCEAHHIEIVSLLYPNSRIVVITTPVMPHFEILMLEVLRARLTMPATWTVDQKIAHLNQLPRKVSEQLPSFQKKESETNQKIRLSNNK
jgi:hypothetical protein